MFTLLVTIIGDPNPSASEASASDKNFTLLSCCCCCFLILLQNQTHTIAAEPGTAPHRAASCIKKLAPSPGRNQSPPAFFVRWGKQGGRSWWGISFSRNLTGTHTHAGAISASKTTRERTQIQGGGDTKSGSSFGPLPGPIRNNLRMDTMATTLTHTIQPKRTGIVQLCSERERDLNGTDTPQQQQYTVLNAHT